MFVLQEFLEREFLGNALWRWIAAPILVIVALIILRIIRNIIVSRIRKLSVTTENEVDDLIADIIDSTRMILFLFVALYAGTRLLILPEVVTTLLQTLAIISLLIQAAIWANQLLVFLIKGYVRTSSEDGEADVAAVSTLSFIGRLMVWTLIGLLIIENIPGVEVSSLIAGLGITGIAVALAVQNVLGDLIASLSILLDKPFEVDDFIVVGDLAGTVEHVGLKTTRLRSLSGELLVFANTDLVNSRVRNYKKMWERRIAFSVGVTYDTPADKLEAIPGIVQEIIEAQAEARFDRAHFSSFGDSALNFEIVYHTLNPDYSVYMDQQQAINLALFKRFADEGIEFAYPTQTLFVVNQ